MRYAVVIEKTADNYSAYAPDLPGCIATGDTIAEVERELRDALEHIYADNTARTMIQRWSRPRPSVPPP